jgi:uncharacterized protein (TIGR02147 family)
MNYYQYSSSLEIIVAHVLVSTEERGYKARLAAAAGCQRSFLSQVLAGAHTLTPEHGVGLAQFWGMRKSERDYFVDMINFERAGTPALRDLLSERINDAKAKAGDLSVRFQAPTLPHDAMEIYYSTWLYAAVHMLLTVAQWQLPSELSHRLQLPLGTVREVLQTLVNLGLAKLSGNRYIAIKPIIHLPKDSQLNRFNHGTWRQYAMHKTLHDSRSEIHYTAIYSLSRQDQRRLQEMVQDFIDSTRRVVEPSKEEEVVALLIDYFVV